MCSCFRSVPGALDAGATRLSEEMKIAAAHAIASYVKDPTPEKILPDPLDRGVAKVVAEAVAAMAKKCGCVR
jgi:malate dehydrogenase (oxaloacetate-decarboxylating)